MLTNWFLYTIISVGIIYKLSGAVKNGRKNDRGVILMSQINLDYTAAAPLPSVVLDAMLPYFSEHYGNPSSGHNLGEKPKQAVEEAREKVARLIGASDREIIFTASASEANNLAVRGLAAAAGKKGNHIISSGVEHFSILNQLKTLEKDGFAVTLLPVDKYGRVNPDELAEAINEQTILITIQTANPEIGTIQPIKELAAVSANKGVPFHTDAAAAAGWLPLNVDELGVSMLTISGDQFYGPKGSGALFVGKGTRLRPLIEGGTQEKGLRAGTENVPAIVGLGEAAGLAYNNMNEYAPRVAALRDKLKESLFGSIPHLYLNGHPENRIPRNLNVSVAYVEGEALLMRLNAAGILVASGSSCTSQVLKSSHVLKAIGVPAELAQGSLQFALGKENSTDDIPYVTEKLAQVAELLRSMSPLYHKFLKEENNNAHVQ